MPVTLHLGGQPHSLHKGVTLRKTLGRKLNRRLELPLCRREKKFREMKSLDFNRQKWGLLPVLELTYFPTWHWWQRAYGWSGLIGVRARETTSAGPPIAAEVK